jgi:hypothetical protein
VQVSCPGLLVLLLTTRLQHHFISKILIACKTNHVTEHLIFPHAWVRTAAGRLLNMLFNVVPAAFPRTDRQDDDPLSMVQVGMRDVARKLTQQLKSEHLDTTQNLHREML